MSLPLNQIFADPVVLGPHSSRILEATFNSTLTTMAAVAWTTSNKAYFIPITVFNPFTVVKLFIINGGTVSGNVDVGIYDVFGNRLVSSGSTAQAGTSAVQEFDITDTLLSPGLYYLGCAFDNTTATLQAWAPSVGLAQMMGVFQQTSAFTLPNPATFAQITGAPSMIPGVFAISRTTI